MDIENVYDSSCPLFYLSPEERVEVIWRGWPEECTEAVSGRAARECPEDDHGFNLIPFQTKVECSEHCVVLVSFLVREATGYHHYPPPPSQLQDWVRRSLQAYAPQFTRTIAAIPIELIPPGSHMSNIDMRIEVRLAAIDFKKDEAVFKLDNTSARKLEVFYTELVGREPGAELTENLSKLRVRMAMAGVIGDELLGFQEAVGGLFDIDDWHASVSYKEVQHESDTFDTVQEEWASFCQSLREHQVGRYLTTQYEASPDDWGSLQDAGGGHSDNVKLETFPEDGSTSPQAYWAPKPMRVVMPQQQTIEGPTELSGRVQQGDSNCSREQCGNQPSSTPAPPNLSIADFSRGMPKAYGDLEYSKPVRLPRIPPTPTLVSCVDPSSPPLFTLPDPVTSRSSLGDGETRREFPNSPLALNISTTATNGSVEGSGQNSTPPLSSRTSSTNSGNEVTSPSSVSTHSHPPVYDAFPRVHLASDSDPIIFSPHSPMWEDGAFPDSGQWKKQDGMEFVTMKRQWMDNIQETSFVGSLSEVPLSAGECHFQHPMDIEAEDLDEYGFELDVEVEFVPLQTKAEKEVDPTEVIIQGRMEAMLDAAQSQGYIYQATRDGLDNHPISVRLRSISGDHSSMKDILGERRYNSANDNTTNARATGLADHQNARSEPLPLLQETIDTTETIRNDYSTPGDYLPPITSNHCVGSTTASSFTLDTPSSHNLEHTQSSNQNSSEYKAGVKSRTDHLKEMKLQFEYEGELMLGAYHRTLERVQILEIEILKSESEEERSLEKKAREMIEFCGYDESAFTQETNPASPTGKSADTFMEGCTMQKDFQGKLHKYSFGS